MGRRLVYLDLLRCLAMLLVMVLHTVAPVLVDTGLYQTRTWYLCMLLDTADRMGVPIFFMISGYLMLRRESTLDLKGFYRKNLPKLAVPLVVWNGIYGLADAWRAGEAFRPLEVLEALVDQGISSHMWFIYVLLGIYLLCPFLKRMVDHCTGGQQLVLVGIVLFAPTLRPVLNAVQPMEIYLFGPLMEGCLGYFLLGYWLGRHPLHRRVRYFLYALGIAGYLAGTVGNLMAASPQEISLPLDGGYSLQHYLTSSAVFVWVRTFARKHRRGLSPAARPLAWLSDHTFGVYWVHVLVLNLVTDWLDSGVTTLQFVGIRLGLTVGISLLFVAVVSRIPVLRRLLM